MFHAAKQKAFLLPQHDVRHVPLSAFSKYKLLQYAGAPHVAIPDDLATCRALAHFGVNVPSGITRDYNWSGPWTPFKHQEQTADFMVRNPRSFVFNDIGCVDGETEYLSPTGWKRIDQYERGDVAQYNLETGQAEFVRPTAYIKKPCDQFYHFKTKYGIDQMLSAEHRVLYVGSTGKPAVRTAEDIAERHQKARYGFKGRIINTFKAPERDGIDLTDTELRLMVAVIADGHFSSNTRRCVIRVKKQRKVLRLRQLLDEGKISFKHRFYSSANGFEVFSFYAPLRLKTYTKYFWGATPHQLNVIAEEVHHWDGSIRKADGEAFFSTEKQSADFINYCYAATGKTTAVYEDVREKYKTTYVVHARKGSTLLYITGMKQDGTCSYENIQKRLKPGAFKYCFSVPSSYLILRRNGKIFVTGNSGKTMAALWAIDYLQSVGDIGKVLISCPMSVMDSVWGDMLFMHFPHLSYKILHGTKQQRLDRLYSGADVFIVNHDGCKVITEELQKAHFITTIIIDELAVMRNYSTDVTKTHDVIAGAKSGRNCWGLTGSPAPNKPTDIWAQARIVNPSVVPKYFTRFREQVMKKVSMYQWVPRRGWEQVLFSMVQPSIRFKRDECLDLPPCTTIQKRVELSKEQRKAYNELKTECLTELKGGVEISAANEAVKLNKFLQISAGYVYDSDGKGHGLPCANKLRVLLESVEEAGGKAIVYTPFRATLQPLVNVLQKRGYRVKQIHSGVKASDRADIFRNFQADDSDIDVIVSIPGCIRYGVNLTASNTIINWSGIDDYDIYSQAMGRITRAGQTKPQTIINLTASPAEEKVCTRNERKEKLQGILLELLEN